MTETFSEKSRSILFWLVVNVSIVLRCAGVCLGVGHCIPWFRSQIRTNMIYSHANV